MKIITRQQAIKAGLSNYFTGKECQSGHIAERATSTCACRQCARERAKQWAADNPVKYSQRQSAYRKENREKLRQMSADYLAANRDPINEKRRQKRKENPDHFRSLYRQRMRKPGERKKAVAWSKQAKQKNPQKYRAMEKAYRQKHRQRLLQYSKEWRQKNPEKWRAIKAASAHNRRVRLAEAGTLSASDIRQVLARERCEACGETHQFMEVDYLHPLFLGGTNHLSNLQLLCRSCNRRKSYKSAEEWFASLSDQAIPDTE